MTPLIPSQQPSLIGTRTAFTCQLAIALTEGASLGPSKTPQPWTHAYSLPERFTPCRWTTRPLESSSRLPETWIAGKERVPAPGADPANEQSTSTPRATVSILATAIAASQSISASCAPMNPA